MLNYEYDEEMIKEMQLIMENNEDFYDAVRIVKELYFSNENISAYEINFAYPEIVSHAACYAFNLFVSIWEEIENAYALQAEYFKACDKVIPELMTTM